MAFSKFAGLVSGVAVLSVAATVSITGKVLAQNVDNSYRQSNPAVSAPTQKGKDNCQGSQAQTVSDSVSAPTTVIHSAPVAPPAVSDPAAGAQQFTVFCPDVTATGGKGGAATVRDSGNARIEKGAVQNTVNPTASTGASTATTGPSSSNNGGVSVKNDTSTRITTPVKADAVQPGGPANAALYTCDQGFGVSRTVASAPGETEAGSGVSVAGAGGDGSISGAVSFGKTARVRGLTPTQGIAMLAPCTNAQKAIAEQLIGSLRNGTLTLKDLIVRPVGDTVNLTNTQDQNQWQAGGGQSGSAQRARQKELGKENLQKVLKSSQFFGDLF